MPRTSEPITWLSLVDISGPFLVGAVLELAFPQGLEKIETPRRQRLRAAYDEWQDAVEELDPQLPALHDAWVQMVLEECLEYDRDSLVSKTDLSESIVYRPQEHTVEFAPDFAVRGGDGSPRLLFVAFPAGTDLENPLPHDTWPATPAERMTLLCRASQCRIGLITNGEQWMLVNAPVGETSGYASWYARLWWQEPVTLKAFQSLLGVRRCFGPEEETLSRLLERSLDYQEEVTNTLGEQVRRAVEVLIQALGRADQDRNGELLKDIAPAELYEAGLTVMMRLVFILSAEERGLVLLGDPLYDQHYAISTLRAKLREDADQHGVEVLERRNDAWSRLLATFRGIYGGIEHEALRLPALGGSLFDPDRFPFLEGRAPKTTWREQPAVPLPIDNRTVLLLMTALQILEQRGGAQLLSYRALDVEQIGHVYEGLLEFTAARVPETTLGLIGTKNIRNPKVTLSELELIVAKGQDALLEHLKALTGRSLPALRKNLKAEESPVLLVRLVQASNGDVQLARRLLPFGELIRADSWGNLLVYRQGTFVIDQGSDRQSSGTHYTPRSLTEPIVRFTLEPLVYIGPAEGYLQGDWNLKSSAAILALKICDMACGSGAFLVEACRYLGLRLVEAWTMEEARGLKIGIDGIARETLGENEPLPKHLDDRLLVARRLVAQSCLYGVDINPLAVELAKLAIWLVTLAKNKPFSFLDHALRCGDSLVGLHDLEQMRFFNISPDTQQPELFKGPLNTSVDDAIALRLKLEGKPADTVADVEAQEDLLDEAEDKVARLKCVADLLVSASLWCANNADKRERLTRSAKNSVYFLKNGSTEELEQLAAKERHGQKMFHWPLEFPEVVVANGGFDCIITNPPFVEGGAISDPLRKLFTEIYSSLKVPSGSSPASSTKVSLVGLFAERICTLVKPGAPSGFLCPKPFLRNERYWRPREVLLNAAVPIAVFDLPHNSFASASVETCGVVVGKKPQRASLSHILVLSPHDNPRASNIKEVPLADTLSDERFTIRLEASSDDLSLLNVITNRCAVFSDFFESRDGVNPGRKDFKSLLLGDRVDSQFVPAAYRPGRPLGHALEAPEPFNSNRHKPTINGRDFSEFSSIDWQGTYLRYAADVASVPEFYVKGTRWSAQLREREHFDRPEKVVSRQTAATLIATLDTQRYFPLNNVHVHFPCNTNDKYCCRCLLGLFNSTLLRYVYRTRSEETGKVFPQVHISAIRQLPVPKNPSAQLVATLRLAVNSILDSEFTEAARVSLDDIVFELYGLDRTQREAVMDATRVRELPQ